MDDLLLEKRSAVKFVVGETMFNFASTHAADKEFTEADLKKQFRDAEKVIKSQQTGGASDGYILMNDIIYKVYKAGTPTGKITGDEAKQVKRRLKAI